MTYFVTFHFYMTDVFTCIEKRRTIRHYDQNWKCPREHLEAIVDAALKSPTACNRQGIDLLVIQNKETLAKINEVGLKTLKHSTREHMLERINEGYKNVFTCDAPVLFLLVKNDRINPLYGDVDAGIMCESIMLTVASYGYGTMCIGVLRATDLYEAVGIRKEDLAMAVCMGKIEDGFVPEPKKRKCKATYLD